jgi:hypothetical protein
MMRRRRRAQQRLTQLILQASLDAHRAGNDELACALYDATPLVCERMPRSWASYDETALRDCVDRMVQDWQRP